MKGVVFMQDIIYGFGNIHLYNSNIRFESLMFGVKEQIYKIPNTEEYNWDNEQIENLAISLIKGFPIQPIYVYRDKENKLKVLDGSKRLLSLYLYYNGKGLRDNLDNYIFSMEQINTLDNREYNMKYYSSENELKSVNISYDKLPSNIKSLVNNRMINIVEVSIDKEKITEDYLNRIKRYLNQ